MTRAQFQANCKETSENVAVSKEPYHLAMALGLAWRGG